MQTFQVTADELASWARQIPNGTHLTHWCLESGKIDQEQYLKWAREHYQLMSVEEEFFDTPPSQDLWKKISSVANWSPALLPLAEWDGVVFIGCVEPIADFTWSFPVQYVLAPAKSLSGYWNQLHSRAGAEGIVDETPYPDLEESPLLDAPTGLNISIPKEDTTTKSFALNSFSEDAPPTDELTGGSMEMPEGLSLVGITSEPVAKEETVTKTVAPPKPAAQSSAQPVASEQPKAQPVAEAPAKPAVGDKSAKQFRLPSSDHELTQSRNEDEVISWAFHQLGQEYIRCMTLLKVENNLQIWKYDENWAPRNQEAFQMIDTSEPSVFRIVCRTGLPYHGPVAESPLNNSFFKNWGMDELPETLTLVPLNIEGHMVGVICCVAGKDKFTPQTLKQVEIVSAQMSGYIKKLSSQAA